MNQTPPEVIIASISFMAFWVIAVLVILIAGQFYPAARGFRNRMITKWKPALVIAIVYALSTGIGREEFLNPYAIAVFCQVMIGLAIASGIEGFSPLPVIDAIDKRKQILRQIGLMILLSIIIVFPALIIGTIGLNIGQQLFGETNYTRQVSNTLSPDKWRAFFLFLGGAGIGEETPFRLVLLSFIWKVSKRKWLAIIASAFIFAAYHFTPLDGMYRIFWQFPISQFTASMLIGLVWGFLFANRGYETTVLGHTLSDWLPLLFFPV